MSGWLATVVERRRRVVALAALAAALALPGLARLEVDNSPEVYVARGTAQAARQAAFAARFATPEALRLVVSGGELWTGRGEAELARLARAAARLAGVRAVSSWRDAPRAGDALRAGLAGDELRALGTGDSLARGLGWVSPDGRAVSLLVEIEELPAARFAALERELGRLAAGVAAGLEATVVGARSLERALDDSSLAIGRRYFPLLVGLAVALLAAAFRDPGAVVAPLGYVAFCEIVMLGAMGWLGVRLHLVLAVLPPVLFVIALATAVHLMIRCRALVAEGREAAAATLATYREKRRAVAWVGLSTACGFAALTASGVAPVRELGVWATAGLAVQLGAAFSLLPALLAATAGRRAGLPERALEERLERLGRAVAELAARRRGAVLALYLAAGAAGAAGLGRLEAESDILRAFAPEHPVRRAVERSESLGIGVSALELELVAAPGTRLDEAPSLAALAALAARLGEEPEVLSVAGPAELLDAVGAASPWAELAGADELRGQALAVLGADAAGMRQRARFLAADGGAARLTLFVRTAGYERLEPLALRAEAAARELVLGADAAVTGTLRGLLGFHRGLLATLGRSLALALPALTLVFFALLRSAGATLRALVPNVWPVLVLLGGMGWLGVKLDLATVMVASIVLGLAVDDTIHTLAHYREESRELGSREAVTRRIERAAPAYLLTGAILVAGFGVCALSDFAPIARFGELSAIAVALAVMSDLVLVPALFGGES